MKQGNAKKNTERPLRLMIKKTGYLFIFLALISALSFCGLTFLSHKGMPEAQVFLGHLYKGTQSISISNKEKAKNYFLLAAKQGDMEGECALGELYESQQDHQKAAYWYLQSGFKGSHRCQINFTKLNFSDEFVVFKMLKKKASENISFAEFLVGKRLIEGVGVKKNIDEGVIYLKKSVSHGSKVAKIYLSRMYITGEVIEQDYDEAKKLLDSIKE